MPVLSLEGAMTIVAHADDDLLFMNPDIAQSITAGEANTTVFVTGGDAGYDDAYWMGREEGIKAAYSLMAGSEDWIDEIIPIDYGGSSFELSSSTLVSAPEVRLYFLRIPDGAGAIEDPADYFSLARLEDGTLGSVTTIDDTATYSRSDLVNVLTGLMETHRPTEFRLQVAEGEYSSGEHTDHIHTTQFAEEALSQYSGTDYQVTHYVNYLSSDLPENLTDAEATLSLEVMEAYAAHDPGVTDETGALLPEYIEWTTRQYVAETATISSDTSETNAALSDAPDVITDPSPPEDGNVAQTGTYTLGDDPDSFLFDVNATTGELTPKDWFTPSLDDAWDINEDYIYEVTRIMTPADGGPQTVEIIRFDTIAEGILEPYDSGSGASDNSEPPLETSSTTDTTDPIEPEAAPPSGTISGLNFTLEGDDVFLFEIDAATGEITTKDWFHPNYDDAWDQNEDHNYELTRLATDETGTLVSREFLTYQTSSDNSFNLVTTTEDILLAATTDDLVLDPTLLETDDPLADLLTEEDPVFT